MSTVAEIIEAVKEWPETEKGVLFRELDPLRETEASRGSLARKNGRWVLRGGEAAAAADAWETTRESRSRELPGCGTGAPAPVMHFELKFGMEHRRCGPMPAQGDEGQIVVSREDDREHTQP